MKFTPADAIKLFRAAAENKTKNPTVANSVRYQIANSILTASGFGLISPFADLLKLSDVELAAGVAKSGSIVAYLDDYIDNK